MKRKVHIILIAVVFCGICFIGMECKRYFEEEQQKVEAEQKKAEEAEHKKAEKAEQMEQIQRDFEELVAFAQEHQESFEKLSVASVEQMMQVMNINDFDYEQACEMANIGDDAEILKEKFYLDISAIKYSIEWQNEYPKMPPEVAYIYRSGNSESVEMFLIYFYTDTPKETWEYYGSGSSFDGYEQISEHLYAVWNIPRYT